MAKVQIEGPRIRLRDYQEDGSDLDSVCLFIGDPKVAIHSSWGPLDRDETTEFMSAAIAFSRMEPRGVWPLALVLKATDEVIGHVSLHIRNASTREAEIGYTLRPDCWGQGYATEAAQAIVGFAIQKLGMHRIIATTAPGNTGSQKVLEKIGFQREGHLRKNVLQRGAWRDSFLYSLLDEEFAK